jgi:hypothetical protein
MRSIHKVLLLTISVIVGGGLLWQFLLRAGKQGTAHVDCGSGEVFESNLGILNVPRVILGQVFVVDTRDMVAFQTAFVPVEEEDLKVEEERADLFIRYSAELNIRFSADVPATVQAEARETIARSTSLVVNGARRETMANVLALVESSPEATEAIKEVTGQSNSNVPFVVHAMVYADSVKIDLGDIAGVDATKELPVGDYNLEVDYSCSQVLKISGSQAGMFFKATPIGYSEELGFFRNTEARIDLTKVDLRQYVFK